MLFRSRCPQVELVLHTASTDEMLQLLSTNQVDLVYTLDQPLLQPALVLAADVPEPVCFIAPPPHPLAQESVLPLDILPRQEFLLTERGMSYRDALDQCMAAHGLAIHPLSLIHISLQPAQQVRGSLRIALADSVCSTFLPELLQRYHARCPQVELVLHTASTDEMLQLLSTNQAVSYTHLHRSPLHLPKSNHCVKDLYWLQ